MKDRIIRSMSTILPLMGIFACSACQAVDFPEDEYPEVSEYKLTVLTRSTNQEFSYPVKVFGFSEAGLCIDAQTIASEDESLSLKLPSGRHKVVAVSGGVWDDLPAKPSLHDVVNMPSQNYLNEPVSMGQADVTMTSKSQEVTLLMSHRVAKVSFSLKNVPDKVTDVQITVSKPLSQLSLSGEEGLVKSALIPCRKSGKDWVTGTVYLLPTLSQSVNFSVSLTQGEKVETYGYQYAGGLEANTPYILSGTYTEGAVLTSSFLTQEWNTPVEREFTFGPGAAEEGEERPEQPSVTNPTGEIPKVGSLWEGHVVADVEEKEGGANLLLLSLMEWTKLTSANYAEDPNVAQRLAKAYIEGTQKDWRIPTEEEARILRVRYQGEVTLLNNALKQGGGTEVSMTDDKEDKVRYLCDDAKKSFSLASNTTISAAGKKANTYRLRLVKTVKVWIE